MRWRSTLIDGPREYSGGGRLLPPVRANLDAVHGRLAHQQHPEPLGHPARGPSPAAPARGLHGLPACIALGKMKVTVTQHVDLSPRQIEQVAKAFLARVALGWGRE